jgi:endonuclease YncB( thermonuclease family)
MRLGLSTAALALCLLVPPVPAGAMEASGPAVIVDGDTLWVGGQEVRIHGIDAPETSQKCQLPKGTWDCPGAAIDALANMIEGKAVRCVRLR